MKKSYIIGIIIVVLLVIGVSSYFIYNKILEDGKKYEIEKISNYNYFVLKENAKTGVINVKGEIVIEPKYDNVIILNPEKDVFICYEGNTTKVLNSANNQILSEFNNIKPIRLKNIASDLMYEKSVLVYEENSKFGLVNLEGKELGQAIYESIDSLQYKEGELLVKKDGKFGVINIKGNYLVNTEYEQISIDNYFSDKNGYKLSGYIVSNKTEDGYRYGYIDVNGKIIVPLENNELSRIIDVDDDSNIYIMASKNGQYGLYKNDKQTINNEYNSIRYDKENNILVVEKGKKYGVSTLEGKIIIPIQYEQIDITGMYIYAKTNDVTNVYDKNGSKIEIDSKIAILNTSNDKYKIKIDSTNGTQYSIIDKDNKSLTTKQYSYLEYLYDDYFIVSANSGKVGVIDIKENEVIGIKYDAIDVIDDTKLITTKITSDKTTQIYSEDLKEVCNMANATIEKNEEYIKIYNDTDTIYFNNKGEKVENTNILKDKNLYAKKNQNGKWTFINKDGVTKVNTEYDKVTDFNKYGFAGIKKDGKWGVINQNGEIIVELTYQINSQLEPLFIGKYYQVEYGFGEIYYTK